MKRISLLFLFLPNVLTYLIQANIPTVVVIDNIVREFDVKTPCTASFWANKLENACKCCLIKNAPSLGQGKKPSDVLNSCLKENSCNQIIIDQLLQKENLVTKGDKEEALRNLITSLYDKSIIIEEIEPTNITLTPQGFFTENSLVNFLARAYQEKKLNNPDFSDVACLRAKNEVTAKAMGYQTLQLFSIASNCSAKHTEYILKEIRSGTHEIISLQKYFLVPSLVPYLYPKHVENFPSFVLPSAYISYVYNNKAHYTALMLKVPGELLSSLLDKYKKNLELNKNILQKAYYQTGLAMSNFHRKFMHEFTNLAKPNALLNPTYVHGDAHQANIFYDIDTDKVTFIDNERVGSISPKNPFWDIECFIFITMLREFKGDSNFLNTWLSICVASFLSGYVNAYPSQDRKKLLNELIATFDNPRSYAYAGNNQLYNLYVSQKKIFDYIFDWISKRLSNETPISNAPILSDSLLALNNALQALNNHLTQ